MIPRALILSFLYSCFGHQCLTVIVNTTNGFLEGSVLKAPNQKNVTVYFGVPYAEPPVGELRFQAPKEAKPWKGTLQAHQQSKPCVQGKDNQAGLYPQFDYFVPDGTETSEDCLYLNIWVPGDERPQDAAVMVFVHGGSFLYGAGSLPLYDGSILSSEEGVIVITFNFRLGVFGYLFGDDEFLPGNMASMDQTMAFKWVQNNIAAFGGDPNRVTIFGQSAGGADVSLHPLLPSSRGLFSGVICESATILANRVYSNKNKSLQQFKTLSNVVGCDNFNGSTVKCLQNKSVQELLHATNSNGLKYSLTVDGKYFRKKPRALIEEGNLNKSIAFLLGHTSADSYIPTTLQAGAFKNTSNFHVSKKEFEGHIRNVISGNTSGINKIECTYTNDLVPKGKNYRNAYRDFLTDVRFTCNTNEYCDLATLNGNPVYKYKYSHVPSVSKLYHWQEVAHTYELNFVFGHPLNPAKGYSRADASFSKKIMRFWASFAKFGSPNGNGQNNTELKKKWPIYTISKKENFVLHVNSAVVNGLSFESCSYLEKLSYNDSKV